MLLFIFDHSSQLWIQYLISFVFKEKMEGQDLNNSSLNTVQNTLKKAKSFLLKLANINVSIVTVSHGICEMFSCFRLMFSCFRLRFKRYDSNIPQTKEISDPIPKIEFGSASNGNGNDHSNVSENFYFKLLGSSEYFLEKSECPWVYAYFVDFSLNCFFVERCRATGTRKNHLNAIQCTIGTHKKHMNPIQWKVSMAHLLETGIVVQM